MVVSSESLLYKVGFTSKQCKKECCQNHHKKVILNCIIILYKSIEYNSIHFSIFYKSNKDVLLGLNTIYSKVSGVNKFVLKNVKIFLFEKNKQLSLY